MLSSFGRAYSTLSKIPLHDHYLHLLVKEGMDGGQAKALIEVLDNQVKQKIYEKSLKYLSGQDYGVLMKQLEGSLHIFRSSIFASQKDHMESLRQDFSALDREIGQTKGRLNEETRQLESGIQLDLNLEKKRRAETRAEVERRTQASEKYAGEKMSSLSADLLSVSRQAKAAVAAFGTVAMIGLVLFHATR